MKILSPRTHIENITYAHCYDLIGERGSGYSFDCTEDGRYLNDNPAAVENRRRVLSGEIPCHDRGVHAYMTNYTEPAMGQCEKCGKTMELSHPLSNLCSCGADYNMSGQRLRDNWVQEWAEETGEMESDIFAGDYDPEEVPF